MARSHLLGIAVLRTVVALEPMASMSSGHVAVGVSPTIRRYLNGELGQGKPQPLSSLGSTLLSACVGVADPGHVAPDLEAQALEGGAKTVECSKQ